MRSPLPARAGLVLLLTAGALASVPRGAVGAPTLDPVDPAYEQSSLCIGDLRALDSLPRAVSRAQRTLGFTGVWDLSRGAGVTVGVIDTGITPKAAFGDRLVAGGDLLWAANPRPGLTDCDGHGTLVAGIIAAGPDTATGYAGVAPDARLLAIRQTSTAYRRAGAAAADGPEGVGTAATLATAIDSAVAKGARVINISAAFCGPAVSAERGPIAAAVRRAVAADVVVVAAAGNVSSSGACSPQNRPGALPVTAATPARVAEALTVGSVGSGGLPSDFSLAGDWVDVAAPGEEVISVNPHPDRTGEVDSIVSSQGVVPLAGTSYAAPYVSGVVALVRARFPRLSAQQVMDRLTATASHPEGADGRTIFVGAGVVNPRRALTAVIPAEGAAGVPVPVEAQGHAVLGGPAGPGVSVGTVPSPAPRASAMAPLPAEPNPFTGRAAALGASAGLLGLLGLGLVFRHLRRRGRAAQVRARAGGY